VEPSGLNISKKQEIIMATIERESLTQQGHEPRPNEQTPLLASNPPNGGPQGEDAPLDISQIFLLSFGSMIVNMSFFCIIPFINQMIYDTGDYKEADVGFYAGLIVSTRLRLAGFLQC
jgi:hypothetical protein